MRYASLVMQRLLALLASGALGLLACSSDESAGSGGAQSSSQAASSTGVGGAGGTSSVASSSAVTSSSSGPCTMGTGGACPCPEGACPEVLVEGLASASHLAQNDTDLFYLASIDRVSKAGGAASKLVNENVAAFTLDDTNLYWIDGSGTYIRKSAIDGTAQGPLGNADGIQHPQFLAVDETNLYFATMSTMGTTYCAGVKRLPKAGGPAEKVSDTCAVGDVLTAYGLGVDATSVYWITVVTPGFTDGKIFKADKTATDQQAEFVTGVNGVMSHLVVDPSGLYYMAGSVFRFDPAGGGMPVKVSGGLDVAAFAVDGPKVYVLGDGLSSVDGSTFETTLLAYESGTDVVVDGSAIYWLSGKTGAVSVLKLAK